MHAILIELIADNSYIIIYNKMIAAIEQNCLWFLSNILVLQLIFELKNIVIKLVVYKWNLFS
jgi:hypothetical protein